MLTKTNLIDELRLILSSENILISPDLIHQYSCDEGVCEDGASLADVVVLVQTVEEIVKIVKLANEFKASITCRGAGTNVVGACVPVCGGIVMDFSKMNKIIELNPENMTVRVQSGVIVGDLQKAVEAVGLYYPPDPSNLAVSTIGGSIAQASSGARTFKYGSTKDYVINLKIVTANGEILQTGADTIKNATGYNLTNLFVGSEGTLGVVVEATLKLIVKPESKKVLIAYFDDLKKSIDAVSAILENHITPATIDFMDKNALEMSKKFVKSDILQARDGALIIEIDGFEVAMEYQESLIRRILGESGASEIFVSKTDVDYEEIWSARRASMIACKQIKPNVITDDVIVPRENLVKLVLGVREICEKYGFEVCMVGHVGDGSVHPQIPIDLNDKKACANLKLAKDEIYKLTCDLGGLISGEHGIGLDKKNHIHKVVSPVALAVMKEIKKVFDPQNIFNPNKIF